MHININKVLSLKIIIVWWIHPSFQADSMVNISKESQGYTIGATWPSLSPIVALLGLLLVPII